MMSKNNNVNEVDARIELSKRNSSLSKRLHHFTQDIRIKFSFLKAYIRKAERRVERRGNKENENSL